MIKTRVLKYIGLGIGAIIIAGIPKKKIDVTDYVIHTKKINHDIRFCVIADLHCRRYGENQSKIKEIVDKMKPDAIIIPGDLFDVDRDYEISFELIDALEGYPIYFTSGNHDIYLKDEIEGLRQRLHDKGVHVLEDERCLFAKGLDTVEIYGMKDQGRSVKMKGKDLKYLFYSDDYRILISHRPEYEEFYKNVDCDLIISGHAHGGQFRIPFINKGIYAPQQGFFPKYCDGVHKMKNSNLVISRGLASGDPRIPRLFNDPEIVFITLKPKEKKQSQ